jgi:DNA-binding MarR family transcriptional regulator
VDSVLRASRALVAVAARSLAAAEDEVTLPQYRVLVLLASRGPQRALDLAEQLAVSQSTVTRMCDRLERKELITRDRPHDNRRVVITTISLRGRQLVDAVTRRRRAEIRSIVRRIDAPNRDALVIALRTFADAAGEAPEQSWSLGWTADS